MLSQLRERYAVINALGRVTPRTHTRCVALRLRSGHLPDTKHVFDMSLALGPTMSRLNKVYSTTKHSKSEDGQLGVASVFSRELQLQLQPVFVWSGPSYVVFDTPSVFRSFGVNMNGSRCHAVYTLLSGNTGFQTLWQRQWYEGLIMLGEFKGTK